jgi:SAM-dependent methyltransferase
MAHQEQIAFCEMVKRKFPLFFQNNIIVDIGSLDINGNNRYLFNKCLYIGVDVSSGNNVDLVSKGHELQLTSESIDVIISTECLEHDKFYAPTLKNITRMLKPGGLFLFTCASKGRVEHGTRRTTPKDAPLIQGLEEWGDYYKNLVEEDIRIALDVDKIFMSYEFSYNSVSFDLYFWGIKKGALSNGLKIFPGLASFNNVSQQALIEKIQNMHITRILGDLSAAPRTRLYTTWDTILYVDIASGELRHGQRDTSPLNALFVAGIGSEGSCSSGWLMHDRDGAFEPISCLKDQSWTASRTIANPTKLEVMPLRAGLCAFRSGNAFLSAEPNGCVSLSRTTCSTWECFVASKTCTTDGAEKIIPTETTRAMIDWEKINLLETPTVDRQESFRISTSQTIRMQDIGGFSQRRVILLHHRGNLANRMFQYIAALTLARRIRNCSIVNVSLPEWGIEIPDECKDDRFFETIDLETWDPFRPNLFEICEQANRSRSIKIILADHLQRMEFLEHPEFYRSIFKNESTMLPGIEPHDLLINIRTGDILQGEHAHYPILPISFYRDIISRTGLNPVFVGQLDESEYVRALRESFPNARFISRGPIEDFELIRSAKHIVLAVSTFSWLAAWLSQAETIFLPIAGFYNPAQHREIDLLPTDDLRYRFFLFPLYYGIPEKKMMELHQKLSGKWKEISRNQTALLRTASPLLRPPRETSYSGLPLRMAAGSAITFDPIWYAHEYIDAAMEISEGWFEDPLHHFLEVGRLRGHLPTRPIQAEGDLDPTLPNLALHKQATQSSISQWSRGSTVEQDAAFGVNGRPWEEGFHTGEDERPWWMVDLQHLSSVRGIRIFNREGMPDWILNRASPLIVEASPDGDKWLRLFQTERGQRFGGYSGGRPLVWTAKQPVAARYVRVSIPRREYLHLAEVEVYGQLGSDGLKESGTASC